MIVFSTYYGDLGGGELRMLEHLTLTSLPRQQLSVVLLEKGPLRERLKAIGIDTKEILCTLAGARPRRWLRMGKAAARLICYFRERAARIVFCNTFSDLLITGRVARILRLPVIWRSHADLFPYLDRYNSVQQAAMIKTIADTATRILTTTEYDRRLILNAGLPADRVFVVPLGVDLARFKSAGAAREKVRFELGYAPQDPVIGFVGRLIPQKGHETFFHALSQVLAQRPDARALVVGDALADGGDPDGYRAMLKNQVQKLGLSQAVQFTGFRDDMPELMNAIDIFVHASRVEPFGSVIVEAMAAARPVIASRTLGPQEIIREGESGLLTTPGDSSELASAMLRLLADSDRAQRIGQSGREYATKHYDLNDTIRLMDRHFQEVIEDRVPLYSIREASKS